MCRRKECMEGIKGREKVKKWNPFSPVTLRDLDKQGNLEPRRLDNSTAIIGTLGGVIISAVTTAPLGAALVFVSRTYLAVFVILILSTALFAIGAATISAAILKARIETDVTDFKRVELSEE
ncbi:hypothetical protein BDQ17DRAFT_1328990 [Cyathus striatus]|nr:hypothetical protein BDQ17DRAFT_1328990 [Cyathus striatus]